MAGKAHGHNLQGLLRFALEYTKNEDAPDPSLFEEMDPERKKFLECALKSMTSDVEELQKAIAVLETPSATDESVLNALNVIRDFIDDIDCANNLIKVGGSKIILDCLEKENSAIKSSVLYIIAEMSQNNPFCQEHFVTSGVVPRFISYLKCDDEIVASSALHAISSTIRNYPPGYIEFAKSGGMRDLNLCINSKYQKVFVKACFLIRALSVEHSAVKDEFVKLLTIENLSNSLEAVQGFDLRTETVLSALDTLTDSDEGRLHLQNSNVTEKIIDIIKLNSGKAECEDMLEYANILLDRINN